MSRLEDLLAEATNPLAYSADDVNWQDENGKSSVRQELYREYFLKYIESWQGKSVLDVGSGTGWLANFFLENGAESVEGIEPSSKNTQFARKRFPLIHFREIDLLSFNPGKQYDVVSCVMVLMNLKSMDDVFAKFDELLATKGEILTVVPDFNYFKTPRHDYKLEVLEMSDDEYVARTERPHFSIVDIVRKIHVYTEAATRAGFEVTDHVPLVPTANFRSDLRQYAEFKDKPIMHLLRFRRS
jgi:2-polyprenyl-3-methyl-5-hydroxy-6-metoxy-1,4-benzoquinol methylase